MSTPREFDVVVYGATGYTGKLICRHLEHLGLNFAIGGRNTAKVQAVSDALASHPPVFTASGDDQGSLVAFAKRGKVLITAAGPFGEIGMPVARAAVAAHTHYLDTTGDMHFMRQMAEELDEPAKKAGVVLSPAMGFDVVPGDVAALKAAQSLAKNGETPAIASADVIYHMIKPAPTRGTVRSNLEGRAVRESLVWRGGHWETFEPWADVEAFTFPTTGEKGQIVRNELAETLTVSRALGCPDVNTWVFFTGHVVGLLKAADQFVKPLLKLPGADDVKEKILSFLPEGPTNKTRKANHFHILARVQAVDGRRATVVASGNDPYGLTAEALAVYASLMAKPGYHRKGVLSPCKAADPDEALALLRHHPLRFEFVPE